MYTFVYYIYYNNVYPVINHWLTLQCVFSRRRVSFPKRLAQEFRPLVAQIEATWIKVKEQPNQPSLFCKILFSSSWLVDDFMFYFQPQQREVTLAVPRHAAASNASRQCQRFEASTAGPTEAMAWRRFASFLAVFDVENPQPLIHHSMVAS